MSIYLDTSVLVPLFVDEVHTVSASAMISAGVHLLVSDLARAEFASAIARLVRMSQLDRTSARPAFSALDVWLARVATQVSVSPVDLRAAELMLRGLDASITAPDAVHVAVAARNGAELATLDTRMAEVARSHALPVRTA